MLLETLFRGSRTEPPHDNVHSNSGTQKTRAKCTGISSVEHLDAGLEGPPNSQSDGADRDLRKCLRRRGPRQHGATDERSVRSTPTSGKSSRIGCCLPASVVQCQDGSLHGMRANKNSLGRTARVRRKSVRTTSIRARRLFQPAFERPHALELKLGESPPLALALYPQHAGIQRLPNQ